MFKLRPRTLTKNQDQDQANADKEIIGSPIEQHECQVATKENRKKPIKVSNIPNQPWYTVSTDNDGPYPDGQCNLVLIDKRTRYPVVEYVPSTDFHSNKERLKYIFATNGILRRIKSDRGPPAIGEEGMISAPYGDASSSKSECQSREIHANHKQFRTSLQG